MNLVGCALALSSWGCGASSDGETDSDASPGGGQGQPVGGSAGLARIGDEPPLTAAHALAYDAMDALSRRAGFATAELGDATTYNGTMAMGPSQPEVLASLYFETQRLADDVRGLRDRRPDIVSAMATEDVGPSLAQTIVQGFTLGAVSTDPPTSRGGAQWYARNIVRTLDAYLLLGVVQGLSERSGAGFDRAVGLLFDEAGLPVGLGRLIAEADAACGTSVLTDVRSSLVDARPGFVSSLEEKGTLDPLDRRVIEEGDDPVYDALILSVDRELNAALARLFVATLRAEGFGSLEQSALLGAYAALSNRVLVARTSADAVISQGLDQADPALVDREALAATQEEVFEVTCAP